MEEKQKKFQFACKNHTAWVMFHAGAGITPIDLLKKLSKNNTHFCEMMEKREEVITLLHQFRHEMWQMSNMENGHEQYSEEYILSHGKGIIEKAQALFNYLKGLQDAKAGSPKSAKKGKKTGSVRGSTDSTPDQVQSRGKDDVGEHVARSGNRSTDAARG